MISLHDCLWSDRPLIFCSCEDDLDLLQYINSNYKNNFSVYSSTIARTSPLKALIESNFSKFHGNIASLTEILNIIFERSFSERSNIFDTYVFLDVVLDKQNVRKIKDIITRYRLDYCYTVNLLFINQTVSVPSELERFSEVVRFELPDEIKLRKKSDELCGDEFLGLKGEDSANAEVVNNLRGLTLFEVEQAYSLSYSRFRKIDLDFVRDFKKAAIAKTDLLSLMESNITFDDIGGLSTLKSWIIKSYGGWTVEGKKFGLPLLKGLLLVGIPGGGKSLSAKAIGNTWHLPVINFDPARVFSSRLGVSEENIRRVLGIIEDASPCILFIDEIEKAFAGSQSSTFSDSGVTARVIMTFLVWMQECTAPVFTVATSNSIQSLPPELISRFDQVFFVNLPQYNERLDIFKIHLKNLKRDPSAFDLHLLAEKSKDFAGREIEQILKDAMYSSFFNKTELSTQSIIDSLNSKPNLVTTMAESLSQLLKWVGWDSERKDGIRARFAHPIDEDDHNRVMGAIETLIKDVEKGDAL